MEVETAAQSFKRFLFMNCFLHRCNKGIQRCEKVCQLSTKSEKEWVSVQRRLVYAMGDGTLNLEWSNGNNLLV